MKELIAQYHHLSPQKRRLLVTLMEERGMDPVKLLPIAKRVDQARAPLSFAQERLWFVSQLNPDGWAYNMPVALRLQGQLDGTRMEEALNQLRARHAILRTRFPVEKGQPIQIIEPYQARSIPVIDLSERPQEQRETEAHRQARAALEEPFDLGQEAPFRCMLLKLDTADHVLLLTMHHILADGQSLDLLLGDLFRFYEGDHPSTSTDSIEYADFSIWQREWFEGKRLNQQMDYWRTKLAGSRHGLELPSDHPRPKQPSGRGSHVARPLEAHLSTAIMDLANQGNASLFMSMLTAFQAFLFRYTSQADLNVGTVISGRTKRETQSLVGLFLNTLVLRAQVDGKQGFNELLAQVRNTVLEAFDHGDLPFENLVRELVPRRQLEQTPFFQVCFSMIQEADETPITPKEAPALVATPFDSGAEAAKFDLTLEVVQRGSQITVVFQYSLDLFSETTMMRMMDHFVCFLESAIAAPQQPLATLPLLSKLARDQILTGWNHSQTSEQAASDAVALFNRAAEAHAQSVALLQGDTSLTYETLNRRARHLAHQLIAQGVKPGSLVGLCFDRSPEAIISMLAVQKAGAAFVSIDPNYPQERKAYIIEDADLALLVTKGDGLDMSVPCETLRIEDLSWNGDMAPEEPQVDVTPTSPAYAIYTSGTTGQPKGVLLAHRGLCNLALAQKLAFDQKPGDRILQFASFSFDASVWEIFMTLSSGATLVLPEHNSLLAGGELLDALSQWQINIATLPPSVLTGLRGDNLPQLHTLITAGERCSRELVDAWAPGRRFFNAYGPSETTVCASIHRCDIGQPDPPIGRPIANTCLYILDPQLEPVPVGVAGELMVAGPSVGLGYRGKPELTERAFISNPFGPGRLYRTGDFAKYREDGCVIFLGRRDQQVKLRGFRIELGEIEAMLASHPGVQAAIATVIREGADDGRLVGYVLPSEGNQFNSSELRPFLKNKLPAHMVPHAIVVIDQVPITSNGKIDYAALPKPGRPHEGAEPLVAPRNEVEATIAEIWKNLLGLDQLSVHDDFFELGGHSLLATRVVADLKKAMGVVAPVRLFFENPTVAKLAAVLEAQREGEPHSATDEAMLQPIAITAERVHYPTTFAQQRFWFQQSLNPADTSFNVPVVLRVQGPLNVDALRNSLSQIRAQHDILRTTFQEIDGLPFQVIQPLTDAGMAFTDLSELPGAMAETEANFLIEAFNNTAFDLEKEVPMRSLLVRIAENHHVFAVLKHHIITDGWSTGLFHGELAALYRAELSGEGSIQETLPRPQYRDFAVWQQANFGGDALTRAFEYWEQQLAGLSSLDLPTDRPVPAERHFHGASLPFAISADQAEALHALSRDHGVTLYMTLLAAFHTTCYHLTGQNDFGVGTAFSGRDHEDSRAMLGVFINVLVMRLQAKPDLTIAALLERTRETVLGAFTHGQVPFEQLVNRLAPDRTPGSNPLYRVMFGLQNTPPATDGPGYADLKIESFHTQIDSAQVDLSLDVYDTGEGLVGALEYSTELFEEASAHTFLQTFTQVVQAFAAESKRLLMDIDPLEPSRRQWLIHGLNQNRADFPESRCLHQLFEEQVQRSPQATAIRFRGESVTYDQLNRRANGLAHSLLEQGIGTETIVPIMADRNPDFLAAMIGIMKAGAVYLPLDPNYPDARIQGILTRTNPPIVLHQADYGERLEQCVPPTEIRRIALNQLLEQDREDNPQVDIPEGALAYLLFTSGSTGLPKGVMLPHRGVVNHKWALIRLLGLNADDVVAQTASQSFDISVWQLWTALLVGGTVAMVPHEDARDPERLLSLIRSEGITIAQLVPSFIDTMIGFAEDSEQASDLGRLRTMIPTGEALSAETAKNWFDIFPDIPLINAYGPCECSDDVTTHLLKTAPEHAGAVAIGRSVQNLSVYLLKSDGLALVPQGALGEITIGGVGVGRGYFSDPRRTASAFVPHPFADQPGERLYRTGDIGRILANGNIEFAGRKDNQVKIRGYRIELGEVEAAVLSLADVRQAVVKPDSLGGDNQRLAVWIVPAGSNSATASQIHNALKNRLPQYMLPSVYTFQDSLPTLPNGKLDRKSLTVGMGAETVSGPAYVAPRNGTEQALAELWCQVLGLEKVGIEDNFFEIGGHSLLATRIISRVRAQFEIDLPVMALFADPTVAALALRVDDSDQGYDQVVMPSLQVGERPGLLPLSFTQERLWFFSKLDQQSAAYNIPYAYRVRQSLNENALNQALRAICDRHEILRTTFSDSRGDLEQVVTPVPECLWVSEDWTQAPDAEKDQIALDLAAREAAQPFDLTRDSLFRVRIIDFGLEDHLLLLNFHHIVFDGWSSDLFLGELFELYECYCHGSSPQLPKLPIQFADYALWQRQAQADGYLDQQATYWKRQLEGVVSQPFLPTDLPRPAIQTFHGDDHEFFLPSALAKSVRQIAREGNATVFMTLLAGFYAFLYRYSGHRDLCIGTPIAGRNRAETEHLIGPFINTLALRQVIDPNQSFHDLLQQVRSMTVGAYDHQDLPFERLLNELAIERDLSCSPLFQIMFSMQADRGGGKTEEQSTLAWEPVTCDLKISKFDLTFQFAEAGEELVGTVEYNTDLFKRSTISAMIERFTQMLTDLVVEPDRTLASHHCLLPRENQLLSQVNATQVELPPGHILSRLIEASMRWPNHTAVSHGDQRLDYQQLHNGADQLANTLRVRGVKREVAVGIFMPRCLALPQSLLAVWKAGGAYVPIDAATPSARLRHIAEDTNMPVLLSVSALESTIPESLLSRVLFVDRMQPVSLPGDNRWENPIDPQQTAYILFTSGSTGQPKGVRIPHQAVDNHMCWMTDTFPMNQTDKVLQKTPIGFDASVWEFWMPLMNGAQLVMADPEAHRDPNRLAEILHGEAITWLQMVPSMLQFLVEETRFQATTSLKYLFCGGEKLRPQLVSRFNQVHHAALINLYGPTETCIDATFETCNRTTELTAVTIGKPIQNMKTYLLDADGQRVPPGLPGELVLAGSGLASGYHRQPGLTANSFVPNPFANEPGQRMYRSGDQVQFDQEGNLCFLDRRDNQVKLRGLRIELAEIETVLNRYSGVTAAVVKVITDGVGDQRLTAYVVSGDSSSLDEEQLSIFLQDRLPGYMVPAQFLFMTAFPKTSSGKTDRKALPDPPRAELPKTRAGATPETPMQTSLAEIWAEVLGHQVGLRQKFFEAGGDSLKILKVQNLIGKKLQVEISVVDLFQYNTIESLASFLNDKNPGHQETDDSPENLEIFEF